MKRRDFLSTTAVATSLSAVAGCSSEATDTGYTYTLTVSEAAGETNEQLLDFDTAGLVGKQAEIVETAIRTGTYREENVSWNSLPGRKGISMEFRMVIQLIARHVGRDPQVDGAASFGTPSRYDGTIYQTAVDAE